MVYKIISDAIQQTQLGGADPGSGAPDPLVQRDQVVADPLHGLVATTGDGVALGGVPAHGGVTVDHRRLQLGRELTPGGLERLHVLAEGLGALHDLELDVLELGLAPGQ